MDEQPVARADAQQVERPDRGLGHHRQTARLDGGEARRLRRPGGQHRQFGGGAPGRQAEDLVADPGSHHPDPDPVDDAGGLQARDQW